MYFIINRTEMKGLTIQDSYYYGTPQKSASSYYTSEPDVYLSCLQSQTAQRRCPIASYLGQKYLFSDGWG